MSEDTRITLIVLAIIVSQFIVVPIVISNFGGKPDKQDRITKLEKRVENLEKVITYMEMKDQL